uniref:Chemokine interleukin-8-like domain-containing protein n=2 Tax=Paramormyrops kingsleyae TaxID=1676925 RepID=A0A3B3RFE5_9TELE
MRSAAILLTCILFSYVQGVAIVTKSRCLCKDAGLNVISHKAIEKIEVYYASSSCQHMELIVTLNNGGEQRCLNLKSKFAKNFIKNLKREKRA